MEESRLKHILVVDDDPGILKTITALLESIGFMVTTVVGANAALTIIDREVPDAILTDIHMAEGDGFELINAIRRRGLSVPIVAMSGGSETFGTDHLGLASKLGAAAIVDKPFRASLLAEAIDRAIAGRAAPPRS